MATTLGREDQRTGFGVRAMKMRQSDKKTTKQARIDHGRHMMLKIISAKTGRSVRDLLEEIFATSDVLNEWLEYYVND